MLLRFDEPQPNADLVDDHIRQLEEKHDLLQFQLDGFCVWPLFRFDLTQNLLNLSWVREGGVPIAMELGHAIIDLWRLIFLKKAEYLVITFSSGRSEQVGKFYKDIYFDDLLEKKGNFLKVERLNNRNFFLNSRKALIKSGLTDSAFKVITFILRLFPAPAHLQQMADRLEAILKIEGYENLTARKIQSQLNWFRLSTRIYQWFIKRVKPRCIFTADGEFDIIAAARNLGVTVIEFQHGYIGPNHPRFSWSEYAKPYKNRMPLAERFFLYGNFWKDSLLKAGFWGDDLCAVGSLRMDHYRKQTPKKDSQNISILFTSQGIARDQLIPYLKRFLSLAEKAAKIDFIIKLHPIYETDKAVYQVPLGRFSNVKIISGSETPSTFELLSSVDLHLSISSTCHYEALGLGVPTAIVPMETSEYVMHLYQDGHGFLVQTPEDLLHLALKAKQTKVTSAVSNLYFKQDALTNISALA